MPELMAAVTWSLSAVDEAGWRTATLPHSERTIKMTPQSVRASVAGYLRMKAGYRQHLADSKPRSALKNGTYARSLERVAAYVEQLPDDDPTLQKLVACPNLDAVFYDGRETHQGAIHCNPNNNVAGWFAGWADTIIYEANHPPTAEEELKRLIDQGYVPQPDDYAAVAEDIASRYNGEVGDRPS
jgi:hypothetical protein